MASINIAGDTSGTLTLSAPLVAGSNVATLPAATGELSMLGAGGQSWTLVTGSRASGTTYTNNTGKPIMVAVTSVFSSSNVTVNGVIIASPGTTQANTVSFIVPPSATYSVTGISSFRWAELS
jgi:hypothetical protein